MLAAMVAYSVLQPASALHAIPNDDFSIEVSPAVLAATVKPGMQTNLELRVRNAGKNTENLKIETRSFTQDRSTGEISVSSTAPSDLGQWVSYGSPAFSIKPGEWFTQNVHVNLPKEAGFSYPFVMVISRADEKTATEGGRLIKGSVAVFALINVDKPGASRAVDVEGLKTSQSVYEFLPATIELRLHNRGNSIVQPYGNIYLQRNGNDQSPISVLPLNKDRGYILPDRTRQFEVSWQDSFPYYKSVVKDGKETKELVWNWDMVSHFRIGHYTAKVVAVYNDGVRDVPVLAEVGFWVIPWRILAGGLVILTLICFGIWSIVRTVLRTSKRIVRRDKTSD